ncbi:UDP-N-acetylmuramate dehydrogenase [Abditibacterium utsteinense]|uniref:UDP-N-acetylenolpyruvoylglucosamine reductase n=1 Tax=Abditibacterium utsteinense TaxID=1960156 RepID=A0A2S8SSM2_9BACT|nr:UDP-N-acetylmuramate dehydrogenase [Abditibacterium utsteinense]PQV63776.1 UDP-N-acetylmuramate dehydrogenase [Abditibacterium utsteinense]
MNSLETLLELPFVSQNEPLSKHTTIKAGGPAKIWAQPQDETQLSHFLWKVAELGVPLFVLGAGSNIVPSDNGFDGAILHLGKGFATQRVDGAVLVAGGAAYLPKLTKFALENRLGHFEWACGVPGSVGGSVWGNAGARGWNGHDFESRDCAADFLGAIAYDRAGKRVELTKNEVKFAYRKSSLGDLIVVEARFAMEILSEAEATERKKVVRELLERRRATQPANAASAGCIWKNPPNSKGAGALVEQLGLKGKMFGGAQVSEIHGNFVINAQSASAGEIRDLVSQIEAEVKAQTGIELEREARFLN